jgi:hypothetical protein
VAREAFVAGMHVTSAIAVVIALVVAGLALVALRSTGAPPGSSAAEGAQGESMPAAAAARLEPAD